MNNNTITTTTKNNNPQTTIKNNTTTINTARTTTTSPVLSTMFAPTTALPTFSEGSTISYDNVPTEITDVVANAENKVINTPFLLPTIALAFLLLPCFCLGLCYARC